MKALIVGEAPSKRGTGEPFTGPSGERLQRLIGVDGYAELTDIVDLDNLCTAGWNIIEARTRALQIACRRNNQALHSGECPATILMCGKKTTESFKLEYKLFQLQRIPTRFPQLYFCAFPHPSGLNRFWNEESNVDRARAFLSKLGLTHQAP